MSVHAYHEDLAGYSPGQIWHDGCPECEHRGEHLQIYTLDTDRFIRAWDRAAEKRQHGLRDCSGAERALLDALGSIQIELDRAGLVLAPAALFRRRPSITAEAIRRARLASFPMDAVLIEIEDQ